MFHLEFRSNQKNPEQIRKSFNSASVPEEEGPKPRQAMHQMTDTKALHEIRSPVDVKSVNKTNDKKPQNNGIIDEYLPFMYTSNGHIIIFQRKTYDYKMKCPNCPIETRYIFQHISKSSCQRTVDLNDFKSQLKAYKDKYTKENQNKRKRQSIGQQRTKGEGIVRESQNTRKRESIAQQRMKDEDKVKESQNKRKMESRRRQRATDEGKVKEIQNKHKKASIGHQRATDEGKVREIKNKH